MDEIGSRKKTRRTEAHSADLGTEFCGEHIARLALQINGDVAGLPTQPRELDKLATIVKKCQRGKILFQIKAGKTTMGQITGLTFGSDAHAAACVLRLLAAAGSTREDLAYAKDQFMQIRMTHTREQLRGDGRFGSACGAAGVPLYFA